MTRFGPVHSPAGPGPIIQVQVHPYLDLGPPGPGPDFGQSSRERVTCRPVVDTARWPPLIVIGGRQTKL